MVSIAVEALTVQGQPVPGEVVMRHRFSAFLAAYWAVFFAVLALVSLRGFETNLVSSSLIALGTGLITALFMWQFFALLAHPATDDKDAYEIGDAAFAGAVGVLTASLIAGAYHGSLNMLASISIHVAALAGSYVVMAAENHYWRGNPEPNSLVERALRRKALGAAHVTALSSISGRERYHAANRP